MRPIPAKALTEGRHWARRRHAQIGVDLMIMMRMSTAAQQLDAQRGVTPPGETATPKVTIGGRAGIVEKIHDQENVRAVVATVGVQGMKPYATDTDEILAQCVQELIAAAQAKAAAERSDIEGHLAGLKITLDGAAAATADTAQALVGCVTFMQTDGPRDGGGPYVATVEVRVIARADAQAVRTARRRLTAVLQALHAS